MTIRTLRREMERVQEMLQQVILDQKKPRPSDSWVQKATGDTYRWVTEYTKTYDPHWQEEGRLSPYEPFPKAEYIEFLFELFDMERIVWIEKSRDLMISWACVAYFTRHAMMVPRREVLFQTQKKDKVIQLVDYAKCLYEQQNERLKAAFPLAKPLNRLRKKESRE